MVAAGMQRLPEARQVEEGGPLRYETPQTEPAKIEEAEPELALEETVPGWAVRPPPAEPSPARPLTPTRPSLLDPAQLSPLLAIDPTDRFKRGRILHALLQSLPDVPHAARRAAGQRYLASPGLDLTPSEQARMLEEAMTVIEHPDLQPLFGPDSRSEIPITGRIGNHVIAGQVDRLALVGNMVWIVDYKTNRPAPARVEDVPESYLTQMALYRDVLRQIYPDKQIACLLIWTDEARWMRLLDELLKTTILTGAGSAPSNR